MSEKKTDKVFARMGFTDMVIPLADAQNNDITLTQDDCQLIGYEDEDGNECQEDGTYFDQENGSI